MHIAHATAPQGDDHERLHQTLLVARRLRRAGKLDEAQSICEALVAQCTDYVGALQTLGSIHFARRRYEQALTCFVHANMHNPDNHKTLTFLATVYLKLGARVVAAQTLERALELEPDDAAIQQTLGDIYRETNEFELAAGCYGKALRLDPESARAALGLAKSCMQLGRFEEAAAALERAFELKPQSSMVLFSMSLLPQAFVKIDVLAALEHASKHSLESREDFDSTSLYTAAIATGRSGDYGRAWQLLVDANRQADGAPESVHQRRRRRQESSLRRAEAFVPTVGAGDPQGQMPVSLFIMGPSRSGKTTIELLASSIAGVKRGYENLIVSNAVARATQGAGFPTIRRAASLPEAVEPAFAEAYRSELAKRAAGARVFTSTQPAIIEDVAHLSYLIPGVRFVFVKRDLDDLTLRIFMKKYNSGNHYAYDLGNIRAQVAWYDRMADAWTEKLPAISLRLNYEDVIAEPKQARARVAGLLGLPAPRGDLPRLGDDRGCAAPYLKYMEAELSRLARAG